MVFTDKMSLILKVIKTENNTIDRNGMVRLVKCALTTNLSWLTIKSIILTIGCVAIKICIGTCLSTQPFGPGIPAAGGVHLLMVEVSDGFFKKS